ncbi:MAG: bifunctional phosphopantothenoylcysteine decarboxylase/phosphopantothenate--cysteine ligase CoaBC [Methanospirillaceae archaeon]|nr:bifunctional phosphopantothenoylcysteine decarboxylase/phosphopantothenate--cysteine ligase CoaBC [Methanospirillaceae archaeon]
MNSLEHKTIVLAVCGSIAAVNTIALAHALRRKGAVVQAVMSEAACRIIHPDALTYATGRQTITNLSGMVEHVLYCGDQGIADLLLIAPCTANTISKIACGIDDTTPTTFASTALGRPMPVVLVPAMHHAMYRHQGIGKNLACVKDMGIFIIDPRIEEGKAKIAPNEEIILKIERILLGSPLSGRKVLITSGRCEEPLDDIRILTTRSSGRMGEEIAYQAYRLGADVTIVHANHIPCVENRYAATAESMQDIIRSILATEEISIYISAAAISDFAPVCIPGKIPSGEKREITLIPRQKILPDAIHAGVGMIVAFKLGEDAIDAANSLISIGVSIVAANTKESMGGKTGSYHLITKEGHYPVSGTKEEIAAEIFDLILTKTGSGKR